MNSSLLRTCTFVVVMIFTLPVWSQQLGTVGDAPVLAPNNPSITLPPSEDEQYDFVVYASVIEKVWYVIADLNGIHSEHPYPSKESAMQTWDWLTTHLIDGEFSVVCKLEWSPMSFVGVYDTKAEASSVAFCYLDVGFHAEVAKIPEFHFGDFGSSRQ